MPIVRRRTSEDGNQARGHPEGHLKSQSNRLQNLTHSCKHAFMLSHHSMGKPQSNDDEYLTNLQREGWGRKGVGGVTPGETLPTPRGAPGELPIAVARCQAHHRQPLDALFSEHITCWSRGLSRQYSGASQFALSPKTLLNPRRGKGQVHRER